MKVEIVYPIYGQALPTNHNYQLYSSLCSWNAQVKEFDWQLKTINGFSDHQGKIHLGSDSTLAIRCNVKDLAAWMDLQEVELGVNSYRLKVGQADIKMLTGSPCLRSRMVTIKHQGKFGNLAKQQFRDCLLYKLFELGIRCDVKVEEYRKIEVSHRSVFGYGVRLTGLNKESSKLIQELGLGGRKRMGCGYFEPK